MRTVTFQSVLHGVARLLGLNPTRDLSAERAATFCEYINRHVATGWRFDFWPEWTRTELRRYRPSYATGDFIELSQEVYYPAARKYYQALQLQVSAAVAPATLTNGEYEVNATHWAECAASYQVEDWATGETYAVGDQVRNPDDGEFYQCIAAHTAGASLDSASFAVLTPFARVIASVVTGREVIDGVKQFSRRDPRVYRDNAWPIHFQKTDTGYLLPADAPNEVWVQFRPPPPVFTTTRWVNGTTYDLGALVYYAPTGVEGDVFKSALGNNSEPVDGVTNWIQVAFPEVLADFVKRAAQADALRDQKQTDRARLEMQEAEDDLQDALDEELAGQGQFETATVQMG
jgi:hypothetical protein